MSIHTTLKLVDWDQGKYTCRWGQLAKGIEKFHAKTNPHSGLDCEYGRSLRDPHGHDKCTKAKVLYKKLLKEDTNGIYLSWDFRVSQSGAYGLCFCECCGTVTHVFGIF